MKKTILILTALAFALFAAIAIPAQAQPQTSTVRINAGGPVYDPDSLGQRWLASSGFTGTNAPWPPPESPLGQPIANTVDDTIYQDEIYGATFGWSQAVANGSYSLTLKFAEIFFPAPGSRTFTVSIEGVAVGALTNWEPLDATGVRYAAYDYTQTVVVSDGSLDVSFVASQNNANIAGIQVVPLGATSTVTLTPTAGSSPTSTATPVPGSTALTSSANAVLSPSLLLDSQVRSTWVVTVPAPSGGWVTIDHIDINISFTGNTLDYLECVTVFGSWAGGGRGACNNTPATSRSSIIIPIRCSREPAICAAFMDSTDGGVISINSGASRFGVPVHSLAAINVMSVTIVQLAGGATITPTTTRTPTTVPASATPTRTATPGGPSPTPQPGGPQTTLSGGSCNQAGLQSALTALVNGGTLTLSCNALIAINSSGVSLSNKQNVVVRGDAPFIVGGTNEGVAGTAITGLNIRGHGPFIMTISNCDNCRFEDFEIHGGSVLGLNALGLQDLDDTVIQRLWIHLVGRQDQNNTGQAGSGAVSTSFNRGVQYLNNRITNTGGDQSAPRAGNSTNGALAVRGLWLGNGGSDQKEYNAVVNGNYFEATGGTALPWHGAQNLTYSNNTFVDVFAGMKTSAFEYTTPGVVLIERNLVDGTLGGHAIQLSGGPNPQQFGSVMAHSHILRNNTFRNASDNGTTTGGGIYVDNTPPDNILVENNLVENNYIGGVYVHGVQNMTVRNNIFRKTTGNQGLGVRFTDDSPTHYTFDNVAVICNTFTGHNNTGLHFASGGTYLNTTTFTDNAFTTNSPFGVIGGPSFPNLISARNNYISGGGASGITAGAGTPSCGVIGPT